MPWVATPELTGTNGRYFIDCKEIEPGRSALDAAAAERLWKASEELVGRDAT